MANTTELASTGHHNSLVEIQRISSNSGRHPVQMGPFATVPRGTFNRSRGPRCACR